MGVWQRKCLDPSTCNRWFVLEIGPSGAVETIKWPLLTAFYLSANLCDNFFSLMSMRGWLPRFEVGLLLETQVPSRLTIICRSGPRSRVCTGFGGDIAHHVRQDRRILMGLNVPSNFLYLRFGYKKRVSSPKSYCQFKILLSTRCHHNLHIWRGPPIGVSGIKKIAG